MPDLKQFYAFSSIELSTFGACSVLQLQIAWAVWRERFTVASASLRSLGIVLLWLHSSLGRGLLLLQIAWIVR